MQDDRKFLRPCLVLIRAISDDCFLRMRYRAVCKETGDEKSDLE